MTPQTMTATVLWPSTKRTLKDGGLSCEFNVFMPSGLMSLYGILLLAGATILILASVLVHFLQLLTWSDLSLHGLIWSPIPHMV